MEHHELTDTTTLEGLAAEARLYSLNARMNLFQLARVFSEAKALLPHGEWGAWVEENAGVEMRTAQQMIKSYERFGDMPELQALERTKLYKMTALPPGTEAAFMETHEVGKMSTREVEKAVREYREELERERAARIEAERRADEAEKRPAEIPESVTRQIADMRATMQEKDGEIRRLADLGRDSIEERNRLTRENADLKREALETQDMLAEQQQEIDRVQGELLDLKSTRARGETEAREAPDELTPDAFAGAVRQFIGQCARMPYMGRTFSAMPRKKRVRYGELLDAVEGWLKGAREALNTCAEEVIEVE